MPALNAGNYKKLFADHDTPRLWIGSRETYSDSPGAGTFDELAQSDITLGTFHGAWYSRPGGTPTGDNEFYYNHRYHAWYESEFASSSSNWFYQQASFNDVFLLLVGAANPYWLGEHADDAAALVVIDNYDATRNYYYWRTQASGAPPNSGVRHLQPGTYMAATDPIAHYVAESISSPTGVSGIHGRLGGRRVWPVAGTSGVVSLATSTSTPCRSYLRACYRLLTVSPYGKRQAVQPGVSQPRSFCKALRARGWRTRAGI